MLKRLSLIVQNIFFASFEFCRLNSNYNSWWICLFPRKWVLSVEVISCVRLNGTDSEMWQNISPRITRTNYVLMGQRIVKYKSNLSPPTSFLAYRIVPQVLLLSVFEPWSKRSIQFQSASHFDWLALRVVQWWGHGFYSLLLSEIWDFC